MAWAEPTPSRVRAPTPLRARIWLSRMPAGAGGTANLRSRHTAHDRALGGRHPLRAHARHDDHARLPCAEPRHACPCRNPYGKTNRPHRHPGTARRRHIPPPRYLRGCRPLGRAQPPAITRPSKEIVRPPFDLVNRVRLCTPRCLRTAASSCQWRWVTCRPRRSRKARSRMPGPHASGGMRPGCAGTLIGRSP